MAQSVAQMVTTRHDTLRQRVAQIWKTSATKRVLGSDFSPLWESAERMTDCLLSSRSMVRIHQGALFTPRVLGDSSEPYLFEIVHKSCKQVGVCKAEQTLLLA